MADKKTGGAKKTAAKHTTAQKKPSSHAGKTAPAPEAASPRTPRDENSLLHRILPYVYIVCAVGLTVIFLFSRDSVVGKYIWGFFAGGCGIAVCLVPLLFGFAAWRWRDWVATGEHIAKSVFAFLVLSLSGALIELIFLAVAPEIANADFAALVGQLCTDGVGFSGGGLVGGGIGVLLYKGFGAAASFILISILLLVFCLFLFGFSMRTLWINLKYAHQVRRERRAAAAEAEREFAYAPAEADETEDFVPPDLTPAPQKTSAPQKKRAFDPHIGEEDFASAADPEIPSMPADELAAAMPDTAFPADTDEAPEAGGTPIEAAETPDGDTPADTAALYDAGGKINLDAIFVNPAAETAPAADVTDENGEHGGVDIGDALAGETLDVETSPLAPPAEKPAPQMPTYCFPPITLLSKIEPKKEEDVSAELRSNAQKLIETLHAFRVNVTLSSVSRGPTITRYELIPEAGTRVRSIANLVDDISLSLATSGIRIEAPIPGKAAVGIEVPNKVVSTVSLRELIEDRAFSDAKSKLTVCLGKDVGGSPIYFDISKMPHLLIAGATGMGKSVCINSIITSILYKAMPDEVKLILIDPKKVEFNIYNGIPHLQTPVVNDPKKAAGALHWAVIEMERRYELIEEVGARKIETYNEIARARGQEVLPYTVIIIDELADLMMTAPDAVEESICRLAQKARAAGMHLIIGTQRPSVDVITGLIKANIPSRIAFTVASQVDSRTIIDIAGAEKLIGRGDMLYFPVGLSKPMRAQGAFVSEEEVEKITDFVKQAGTVEYDADIIERIEREAQFIGESGKKSEGGGDLDAAAGDPKLRDALEIATDLGKISTSLLQRKLSIGYGRAAKIIDIMEARGFVSAPDGQKPREVLISKTQFREMVVNGDERLN